MKFLKKLLMRSLIIMLALFIITIIVLQLPQFGQVPQNGHLTNIQASPQHNGEKFTNIDGIRVRISPIKILKMVQQSITIDRHAEPLEEVPVISRSKSDFGPLSDSLTRITWFGHSAFLLEMSGKKILLDPMLGSAASPFSFAVKRFHKNNPIKIDALPDIDAVFYSHDHYDHLDHWSVLQLKDRVKHFYVPLGLGSHLIRWGVAKENITEMDWWDELQWGDILIACTPCQHFSGRTLTGRDKTLWASWVLKSPEKSIYFSGDSGYFKGFKSIGEKYGPFDFCMVECGQYSKLWKENHMTPEETFLAFKDLKGKILMPIHWGAFTLAFHPWTESVERLYKAAGSSNTHIVTPKIGESILIQPNVKTETWWKKYIPNLNS